MGTRRSARRHPSQVWSARRGWKIPRLEASKRDGGTPSEPRKVIIISASRAGSGVMPNVSAQESPGWVIGSVLAGPQELDHRVVEAIGHLDVERMAATGNVDELRSRDVACEHRGVGGSD